MNPSGITIAATRDGAARIAALSLTDTQGSTTQLLSGVTYQPFGPMNGALYGDGTDMRLSYDRAYRAQRLSRIGDAGAIYAVAFAYDLNGNITGMTDAVRPDRSQRFTYDPLDRLASADGAYGMLAYDYGPTGDRLSRDWTDIDGQPILFETYDYAEHRLAEIRRDGALYRSLAYTVAGHVESDTTDGDLMRLVNDARGRLASVEDATGAVQARYTHDASELRIRKETADGAVIHYHYDQ